MSSPRVEVVALEPFPWQGRAVETGDRFEVRPIDAAQLFYRQKARAVSADEAWPEPTAAQTSGPANTPHADPDQPAVSAAHASHVIGHVCHGLKDLPQGAHGEDGIMPVDTSNPTKADEQVEAASLHDDEAPDEAARRPRAKRKYQRRDLSPKTTTVLTHSS